jgi:hypothetical protein
LRFPKPESRGLSRGFGWLKSTVQYLQNLVRNKVYNVDLINYHFNESKLIEPSRVRIETEISQNEEKREISVKGEKQEEADSDLSVHLQELPVGDSDDDDDGYDSNTSSEGHVKEGSSGSNARSYTVPDNKKFTITNP